MMYEQLEYGLKTGTGELIALQSVGMDVGFHELLCETSMTQTYRNLEDKPIEAVYTFPLASSAVLLALKVSIGTRELQGLIVEKTQAEADYEEAAVTEGDAAIMLEQLQPGLYAMNVGNIPAGEEVVISWVLRARALKKMPTGHTMAARRLSESNTIPSVGTVC